MCKVTAIHQKLPARTALDGRKSPASPQLAQNAHLLIRIAASKRGYTRFCIERFILVVPTAPLKCALDAGTTSPSAVSSLLSHRLPVPDPIRCHLLLSQRAMCPSFVSVGLPHTAEFYFQMCIFRGAGQSFGMRLTRITFSAVDLQ